MQSVPVHRFWQFGATVRYLQDATTGHGVHGPTSVLGNITALLNRLNELEMRVTIRAAEPLLELEKELRATPPEAKLTVPQVAKLTSVIRDLRKTMEAELKGLNAYIVSPKRLNVDRLLTDVASLFAPGVFASLSSVAQLDLSEGAKCIAFERSTASAFHMLRATEEALRRYYCHVIRRNRLKPLLWHGMLQALQKHRLTRSNDALHRNLDNIRLSFRNPTQHPDKIYDIQEAQDLFSLCVDVINRMQKATGVNAA